MRVVPSRTRDNVGDIPNSGVFGVWPCLVQGSTAAEYCDDSQEMGACQRIIDEQSVIRHYESRRVGWPRVSPLSGPRLTTQPTGADLLAESFSFLGQAPFRVSEQRAWVAALPDDIRVVKQLMGATCFHSFSVLLHLNLLFSFLLTLPSLRYFYRHRQNGRRGSWYGHSPLFSSRCSEGAHGLTLPQSREVFGFMPQIMGHPYSSPLPSPCPDLGILGNASKVIPISCRHVLLF
jgi:hypothetical protein